MLPIAANRCFKSQISTSTFGELASNDNEIVVAVPLKAEGAPVPGAGFTPEAVPGNSAEMKNTRTVSHFLRNSVANADPQRTEHKLTGEA
jgi:hypothetical protein